MTVDRYLPAWARRNNPVVRRHLGIDWRVPPIETGTLRRMYFAQLVLITMTLFLPLLDTVSSSLLSAALIPAIVISYAHMLTASLVLPIMFIVYAWFLFNIGADAARGIITERDESTFELLRTTPPSTQRQFLFLIAACIWRRSGTLNTALLAVTALSTPVLVIQYSALMPLDRNILLPQVFIAAGLTTSIVRLWIEPLLAGALGVLCGAIASLRLSAQVAASVLLASYLLLINLTRLLPLSIPMRILVETLLPIVLPLGITIVALHAAAFTFSHAQ